MMNEDEKNATKTIPTQKNLLNLVATPDGQIEALQNRHLEVQEKKTEAQLLMKRLNPMILEAQIEALVNQLLVTSNSVTSALQSEKTVIDRD